MLSEMCYQLTYYPTTQGQLGSEAYFGGYSYSSECAKTVQILSHNLELFKLSQAIPELSLYPVLPTFESCLTCTCRSV